MKLIIVDDDPLVCQSLKLLLGKEADLDVTGVAGNGEEAVALVDKQQPDVILMDIQMPVMDGIESTRLIKEKYPSIHVIMLTTFRDEKNIRLALQAGAEGYLLKSANVDNMADQIRAISAGISVLDTEVLKTIIMEPEVGQFEGLTDRELDIVELVAQGLSNKEIGKKLFLSDGTVRNMLSIVLDKLELRDRTQLAIAYWQRTGGRK
ncbi:DNA-binding response regulator [Xylanibacillus composti]|uniref:DNA-binding response regulator n=1 Tax=Xylanibacillus composti TaxID=1572762 RepID=A0A8J4H6J3_9BACL|nr:response regulator transcription factor [Xylanibacillus composti]MDT9726163.1 DNA-binding response regulator [Xylanibacillus composti]GIQ70602.1 DNA-binding response regulator [Xylanibacillus composti]